MDKNIINKSKNIFESFVGKLNEDSVSQEIADITDTLKNREFADASEEVKLHRRLNYLKSQQKMSNKTDISVHEDNDTSGLDGNTQTQQKSGATGGDIDVGNSASVANVADEETVKESEEFETGTLVKTMELIYLDFVNNYLTIEKFAEHNGVSVEQAKQIIAIGKDLHNTGGYVADR